MTIGHHCNGGECSERQHLLETRGPKRSIQTPQLYPRPEKTKEIYLCTPKFSGTWTGLRFQI